MIQVIRLVIFLFVTITPDKKSGDFTLIAAGDINLVSKRPDYLETNSLKPDYYFKHIVPVINRGKIRFCNFEQTVSDEKEKPAPWPGKAYVFMGTGKHLDIVKNAGFNVINIANNHIMDYGSEGLRRTIAALNKRKMLWFGAGLNDEEARKALIVHYKGKRIAFLGYIMKFRADFHATEDRAGCPAYMKHKKGSLYKYINRVDENTEFLFKKDIDRIKEDADMIIISIHFGKEYYTKPSDYQIKTARAAIDAGADIILGHHPHVIQKIEKYKGKIICYSLGNLVFPSYFTDPYTMIVEFKIGFDMQVYSTRIHPFVVKNRHDFNLCADDYVMFMPVPARGRWFKGFEYMLKQRGFNVFSDNGIFYLKD